MSDIIKKIEDLVNQAYELTNSLPEGREIPQREVTAELRNPTAQEPYNKAITDHIAELLKLLKTYPK